jgi:subtilisin-like proprotein convertase family protein
MSRTRTFGLTGRVSGAAALFATAVAVAAAPAQAKTLFSTTVTVPQAVKRVCFARNAEGEAGVVTRGVRAPFAGMIRVRLTAASGDWDLGVFDAKTGRNVAASAHFQARELADGLVTKGQRLVVQACRSAGNSTHARVTVGFLKLARNPHKAQLVRVATPTRAAKNRLMSLGLDVTEHGGKDFLSVVLHTPREAAKLGRAGFISAVEIADLEARSRHDRRVEADWARRTTVPTDVYAQTSGPIAIVDGSSAVPYPSKITVSGLPPTLTNVKVRLNRLVHDFADDVDVLLVGPQGQKVVLMSDSGGGNELVDVTVTLDDAAANALPDEDPISSGTYQPANYVSPTAGCDNEDPDAFPSPAPSSPYGAALSDFNGTNPNGDWSLYVVDDCQLFSPAGSIAGGWTLILTTPTIPPSGTGFPSGRTGPYRTLAGYTSEMNALATNNPSIVKRFTLPNLTYEGRPVEGIEISTNVNDRDGKPVFLMMGLHHAREWPSGEHTLEWAYQLVNGYNANVPRVVNLVQNLRTLIIPVVNVDGFNMSRTAGEAFLHGNGVGGNENNNVLTNPNEFRRKNCRVYPSDPPVPPAGTCAQPALGLVSTGVDPNRNYGTFWGGPGSSTDPLNETFHGPHCANETQPSAAVKGNGCGPFSEPETENIRQLVSKRHVTALITNHTFTGLVLRAPGLASQGLAVDEPAMKALGDAMADANGYISQYGWQLYDTTGTTEDWTYNTTGGMRSGRRTSTRRTT